MIQKIKNIKRQELKPGHIRIGIDRVVYFEPDGLPKPDEKNYSFEVDEGLPSLHYKHDLEEYEASKQLIEVSNVFWGGVLRKWVFEHDNPYLKINGVLVKDSQPCKAEVGKTATIVELTKE